ncbi:MAG: redoxin domain-containing protein [Ardenticatenaceae bacterium]|nr:redoxin domain-containing protein [Ardenticatenaceae bacterium]MCB9444563.1 redoxin domain-containing protein [Ardenticatenaceae bacterium]
MMEKGNGRHPLAVIGGVILIGLALLLLFFGSRLWGSKSIVLPQIPAFDTSQSNVELRVPPEIGKTARNFVLNDANGQPFELNDFRGQPVILNFWATWCPPCRMEMPDLQAVYERHQADRLVILAINYEETAVTVRDFFYDELDLTFTPLLDETGDVSRLYGVLNYPTSIFVDEDGMVTAVHQGLMTEEQIEDYLAKTSKIAK